MSIDRIGAEEMPRFVVNLPRGTVLPERQEFRVAAPGAEFVYLPQTPEDLIHKHQNSAEARDRRAPTESSA